MKFEAKVHETKCPACGADLTQSRSVMVHFAVTDHEFDQLSSVDEEGVLQDIDGLIEIGSHAGSCCSNCGEELDELQGLEVEKQRLQWYVRFGTGEISGPMSKDRAFNTSAVVYADGKVFNEQIFSPKFSTSPEVDEVLDDLRRVFNRVDDCVSGRVVRIVGQAIDMITLLSREKSKNVVIECSLEGGLLDVESEMPPGVTLVVRDYDIEGCDETERLQKDSEGRECFVSEYAKR